MLINADLEKIHSLRSGWYAVQVKLFFLHNDRFNYVLSITNCLLLLLKFIEWQDLQPCYSLYL